MNQTLHTLNDLEQLFVNELRVGLTALYITNQEVHFFFRLLLGALQHLHFVSVFLLRGRGFFPMLRPPIAPTIAYVLKRITIQFVIRKRARSLQRASQLERFFFRRVLAVFVRRGRLLLIQLVRIDVVRIDRAQVNQLETA